MIVHVFLLLLFSVSVHCTIVVPDGNVEFMKAHGVGLYYYKCINQKYTFTNAEGDLEQLTDRSISLGSFTYTPVPVFANNSIRATFKLGGSSTSSSKFELATISESVNDNSLPNALFMATGIQPQITFVLQTSTLSGIPPNPTKPCSDGDTIGVPFRADFLFYNKQQQLTKGSLLNQLRVPDHNTELTKVSLDGTYNYVCWNSTWRFIDLAGTIVHTTDKSINLGTFFLGNVTSTTNRKSRNVFTINNSSVTFIVNATQFAPGTNTIPQVLYAATSTTRGILENVTFGKQVNSVGGQRPKGMCSANGDIKQTPFTGELILYVKSFEGMKSSGVDYTNPKFVNENKFKGAFFNIKPLKIVFLKNQAEPWLVVYYNGSSAGTFMTEIEAVRVACGIQRDHCIRVAYSDTSFQQYVNVENCLFQAEECQLKEVE